ncbi:MAG: SPOR domain-containing protein, partial [Gammaproteobacteria bacterium]
MARDYKNRGRQATRSRQAQAQSVAGWKWVLALVLVGLFIGFLFSLKQSGPETPAQKTVSKNLQPPKASDKPKPKKAEKTKTEPEEPRFDFYTILPEKEVVVPDYEIKTRAREERVGKAKTAKYVLQAGSF